MLEHYPFQQIILYHNAAEYKDEIAALDADSPHKSIYYDLPKGVIPSSVSVSSSSLVKIIPHRYIDAMDHSLLGQEVTVGKEGQTFDGTLSSRGRNSVTFIEKKNGKLMTIYKPDLVASIDAFSDKPHIVIDYTRALALNFLVSDLAWHCSYILYVSDEAIRTINCKANITNSRYW
jgi:hypothetical protein